MKAVYGSPEVLRIEKLPKPAPKENELLIRIEATVASDPDCAFRRGKPIVPVYLRALQN